MVSACQDPVIVRTLTQSPGLSLFWWRLMSIINFVWSPRSLAVAMISFKIVRSRLFRLNVQLGLIDDYAVMSFIGYEVYGTGSKENKYYTLVFGEGMHWPAIIQHYIFWKLGLEWPFIVASYYLKHLNPQVQSFWIHSSVFSYVIPIESLCQIWSKVRCFNTCVNVNLVNNGGNSDATSLNWSYPLLHPLAHRFPWPMLNPDEVVIFIWGVNTGAHIIISLS